MALAEVGATTRPATPADAEAIGVLLAELGYPSTRAHVEERLGHLTAPDYAVFVAIADERVAGLMGLHRLMGLHLSEPGCYVNALVVATEWRGRGIGTLLLERAESWGRANGCGRITLTSADHRRDAHHFYEHNGFANTGRRFVKTIED
jgi:GNAT superfamily N-acetyltransferase